MTRFVDTLSEAATAPRGAIATDRYVREHTDYALRTVIALPPEARAEFDRKLREFDEAVTMGKPA